MKNQILPASVTAPHCCHQESSKTASTLPAAIFRFHTVWLYEAHPSSARRTSPRDGVPGTAWQAWCSRSPPPRSTVDRVHSLAKAPPSFGCELNKLNFTLDAHSENPCDCDSFAPLARVTQAEWMNQRRTSGVSQSYLVLLHLAQLGSALFLFSFSHM